MKILCDNCGAKYSIADEKVAGRNFKIRCKTDGCGNVIPVQGEQLQSADDAAAASFNYGSDQVWHVVVAGDQQGPFSPEQLGAMLTEGTIDWEAYVWREGLDDWQPARDLPDLVSAIMQEPQGAAAEPAAAQQAAPASVAPVAAAPAAAPAADPFAGGTDAFAAPAADSNPFAGADPFGGAADAGDDLFGSASADADFGGGGDVVASASPRVSAEQAMTGQRNENSVLFSLANLQALATGDSGGDTSSPAASAPSTQTTTEGSGLIDIRALASATAASSSGGGNHSSTDDLMSIGGGGSLGPSLGAPVLTAAAEEPEESSKGFMIAAVVGGGLIVALAAALLFVVLQDDDETVALNGAASQTQAVGTEGATTQAEAPAVPVAAGSETAEPSGDEAAAADDEGSDEAESESDEADEDDGSSAMRPRGTRRNTGRNTMAGSSAGSSSESTSAPAMASPMNSASGSIDDLLNGALNMSSSMSSSQMAAAMSNLPANPSRSDVGGALSRLRSQVQACGNGTSGTAQAAVIFASSGRVQSVNVTGVPPAVRSCVASRVRSARVPPFSNSSFRVNYPYGVR